METKSQNDNVPSSDQVTAETNSMVSRSELKAMDEFENIYSYSRAQAIEDGVLVDLNQGEWDSVVRQHFKVPVACTAAVWALIEHSVSGKESATDYKGIIHDILFLSIRGQNIDPSTRWFKASIGMGVGSLRTMYAKSGPGDQGEHVITIMLEGED